MMKSIDISIDDGHRNLEIDGQTFQCNINDLMSIQAIAEFREQFYNMKTLNEDLIAACRKTIEIVLGKGAYSKLFSHDDMSSYYLILTLADLYQTEIGRKSQERMKSQLEEFRKLVEPIERLTAGLEKMEKLYAKHGVSQKGSADKHHR